MTDRLTSVGGMPELAGAISGVCGTMARLLVSQCDAREFRCVHGRARSGVAAPWSRFPALVASKHGDVATKKYRSFNGSLRSEWARCVLGAGP